MPTGCNVAAPGCSADTFEIQATPLTLYHVCLTLPPLLLPCRGSMRRVCKLWQRVIDNSALSANLNARWHAVQSGDPDALVRLAHAQAGVVQRANLPAAHLPGVVQAARQLTSVRWLHLTATADEGEPAQHGVPEGSSHGAELARLPLGLEGLAHLAQLELDVDDLQASSCAQLSTLSTLTHLTAGTLTGQVPAELWAAVARMPQLAELIMAVQTLDDAPCCIGEQDWAELQACTGLTRLELKHHTTAAYEGCSGG